MLSENIFRIGADPGQCACLASLISLSCKAGKHMSTPFRMEIIGLLKVAQDEGECTQL